MASASAKSPCGPVHILKVDPRLQPGSSQLRYPVHNDDYGIEQDFLQYLERTPTVVAASPRDATWHYLPVYWTRWLINHEFGAAEGDLLERLVQGAILDPDRTFTVCQNDAGPTVDLGAVELFLASRQGLHGIDVPLLSLPLSKPRFRRRPRYLAGFIGKLSTHPVRERMAALLADRDDVIVSSDLTGPKKFAKAISDCSIGLSPRGFGGSSFRTYEVAQLGRVPYMIGEPDTRPFKRFIDWPSLSLYSPTADEVPRTLDEVDSDRLEAMGERAAQVWAEDLTYGRWCRFVLRELAEREPR